MSFFQFLLTFLEARHLKPTASREALLASKMKVKIAKENKEKLSQIYSRHKGEPHHILVNITDDMDI